MRLREGNELAQGDTAFPLMEQNPNLLGTLTLYAQALNLWHVV